MAIFASDFGIEILEKTSIISVDGTFSKCPVPFCQIFVIMAELPCATKASVPVVFGLLPNKKTATYVKFFEEVSRLSEKMFAEPGLPARVSADFEQAIRIAISRVLPRAKVIIVTKNNVSGTGILLNWKVFTVICIYSL